VTLQFAALAAAGPMPAGRSRFSWINDIGAAQVRHGF
jgi:hypothetical protein